MKIDSIEFLAELLEIPSVSDAEEQCAEWLATQLQDNEFDVQRDTIGNVIASRGTGNREVLFLGHIDTALGFIAVRQENNLLYGRGAVDAKGPLCAALAAVSLQPPSEDYRFTVIAAVDEEGDSKGARHLLDRPTPEHLIILEPSGWQGVTVGYKGSFKVHYRLRQAMSHGASKTPSAGDQLFKFVRQLQEHAANLHPSDNIFEQLSVRVLSSHVTNDGLEDSAEVWLGLRLPCDVEIEKLQAQIETLAMGAEVSFSESVPGIRVSKNSLLVRSLVQAIRQEQGTPTFKVKTGTSDMNLVQPQWQCPTVAYGPGDSQLDHAPNEAIDVDEYRHGIAVLTNTLNNIQLQERVGLATGLRAHGL